MACQRFFLTSPLQKEKKKTFNGTKSLSSIQVTCLSEENVLIHSDPNALMKRVLEVKNGENESLTLTHFHFTAWPDFLTVKEMSSVLKLADKVTLELRTSKNKGPLITQCSAGVGRTGTFIAIDIIRRNFRQTKDYSIDVQKVVAELRNQRPLMVMTVEQYAMIYQALYLWLFDSNIDSQEGNQTKVLSDNEMYAKGMQIK
mmetsp:Transcript_14046/g.15999  ORF Transcript_14046/g.15999 Transcript_14046/m.15999 type:complete len:201 (+) Transcript_14046:3-605(+)